MLDQSLRPGRIRAVPANGIGRLAAIAFLAGATWPSARAAARFLSPLVAFGSRFSNIGGRKKTEGQQVADVHARIRIGITRLIRAVKAQAITLLRSIAFKKGDGRWMTYPSPHRSAG